MLLTLSWPLSSSQATPPTSPDIRRVRLTPGQKAPFAGNLLTDHALAKIIIDNESRIKVCETAQEKQRREAAVEKAAADAVCRAKIKESDLTARAYQKEMQTREKIYKAALEKAAKPVPWYKTPIFGFVAGQVVAGGMCIGVGQATQ